MKVKYRILNLSVFMRLLLVGAITTGSGYVFAALVRNSLDFIYRYTQSQFWRTVFVALSQYKAPLAVLLLLLGMALCGGWIMAPIFSDFSEAVSACLNLEEDAPAVKLPKSLRELEAKLTEVRNELRLWRYSVKETEQRKDDLVVYLAHDIRTPLTSVLGYLELVSGHPELPESYKQNYIAIALRKAQRMQGLVEELFEITRFNVSHIELDRRPVNAAVFINQLAEEAVPFFEERGIEMQVENRGAETMFIDGDKMARAIENILQNAARYSPRGETVRILSEPAHQGKTRIAISNTGHEISQSQLDRFFEKFYRGDEARQTVTGGSGLGLAIAKNLIEAHGGTITAQNRDRVTTFTVVI